ncbi:clusterin associated protein 1 isoform X1 [Rhodnius prolixus]|uniref:clusterin associated protein 1 isoform X1 n=1 Tax=Rhodnius prolixus TaxID=13249 RepID=UPI003D1884B1
MSYRDLRNFTEMMRTLGFPRLISLENFRIPNFTLIADILIWLVKRFDPDADIHDSYTTEEDRILLIRTAAEFMAVKANVMFNTKRLYQADGYAVKELLKITTLLYNALLANNKDSNWLPSFNSDISTYIQDLKMSRDLASQVTIKGASIFELLRKEVDLRDIRNSSISTLIEMNRIESAVKEAVEFAKTSIANTKSLIENVSATESSLDAKIEKKQVELERNQKRLQTLKKVRPAFLEEFEKLEAELQTLYQEYVTRTRCISYLEQQHEEATLIEQERMQQRQRETKKMVEEMQQADARNLIESDILNLEGGQSNHGYQESNKPAPVTRRLRTATAAKPRLTTGKKRVFGSMNVAEDDSNSLDSDSDLLLDDDGDNSDLFGSGDDIEGLPLESNRSEQTDDDF